MPIDPHRQERLQQLILNDPQLREQLSIADGTAQVITLVTQAANAAGIEISAAELQAHFAEPMSHDPGALSDDMLDGVAGGIAKLDMGSLVAYSIATFAVGCYLYSGEHPGGQPGQCATVEV